MVDKNTAPYRIVTPRLVLRCWEPKDAAMFEEAIAASLDHLRPWMSWAAHHPADLDTNVELLRRFRGQFDLDQDFDYAIFSPDESAVIGGAGLHTPPGPDAREIGYWIRASEINKGYATEAAGALTRAGFELLGLLRIEIHCDTANVRSAAVPRKLGYKHEATLRRRASRGDGEAGTLPHDMMVWTLFADEHPHSQAARMPYEAFDAVGRPVAADLQPQVKSQP